jgi:hypothetical protein
MMRAVRLKSVGATMMKRFLDHHVQLASQTSTAAVVEDMVAIATKRVVRHICTGGRFHDPEVMSR